MEAFKKKSQEFREVCYQLMGYKIDMPTDNQYRLISMYSEAPGDYMLFQVRILELYLGNNQMHQFCQVYMVQIL